MSIFRFLVGLTNCDCALSYSFLLSIARQSYSFPPQKFIFLHSIRSHFLVCCASYFSTCFPLLLYPSQMIQIKKLQSL